MPDVDQAPHHPRPTTGVPACEDCDDNGTITDPAPGAPGARPPEPCVSCPPRTLPVTPAERACATVLRAWLEWHETPPEPRTNLFQTMLNLGDWLADEGIVEGEHLDLTSEGAALLARVEAAERTERAAWIRLVKAERAWHGQTEALDGVRDYDMKSAYCEVDAAGQALLDLGIDPDTGAALLARVEAANVCPTCRGDGKGPACVRCDGGGFTGPETGYDGVCGECGGQGATEPCADCKGTGRREPLRERTPETVLRAMLLDAEKEALRMGVDELTGKSYPSSFRDAENKVHRIRVVLAAHLVTGTLDLAGPDYGLCSQELEDYAARLAGTTPVDAPPAKEPR